MWAPGADPELWRKWLSVRAKLDLRPCNGCDLCGLRCAEGVQMTRTEFEAASRLAAELPPGELRRVLSQDKRVDLGDGVQARMCRYRDMERGGCAIYEARPLVCRLLGHVEWLPCPVEKVERPLPTPEALALMRAYAAEARRTFEGWEEAESAENERK